MSEEKSESVEKRPTFRFLFLFLLTVTILFSVVIFVTQKNQSPYSSGFNLSDLSEDEILVINQLPEIAISDIKVQHAHKAPAPLEAVFGNHTIADFGANDAGLKQGEFFNFTTRWAGLPDIKVLLSYLEYIGKLPKKVIYVGLPHPHTGAFSHLSLSMEHLPPRLYFFDNHIRKTNNIRRLMRLFGRQIRDHLDWRNIVNVMTNACRPNYGVVSLSDASRSDTSSQNNGNIFFAFISGFGEKTAVDGCPDLHGIDRDGRDLRWTRKSNKTLMRMAEPIQPKVFPGSVDLVVSLMVEIHKFTSSGRKVIFFVPPLYETARKSQSFDIMSKIVAATRQQGLIVIDDRRGEFNGSYFLNTSHPNGKYFADLVSKLTSLK